MPALTKYYDFVNQLSVGSHNLQTAVYRLALTNTAPSLTDINWNTTTYPAPAAVAGYTSGGNTPAVTSASTVNGLFKLILANTIFSASGGQIGPFRYAILYNSSTTGTLNRVIGWYDYGSSFSLNDQETYTFNFDATNGVFTMA